MGFTRLHPNSGFVLVPADKDRSTKVYKTVVDQNGIIQVVQREKKKRSFGGLKLIALVVVLMTLLKALGVVNLGTDPYAEKIAALGEGTGFEKVAAWAMHADPVTLWVADLLRPALT